MLKFHTRESNYPIDSQFLERTSSRAFSQERFTEEELMTLFEAARWAPSSYNAQPWRFIYARRGEKEWQSLFDLLIDFNKSWCKEADTLILVIARNKFEHNNKPAPTASFDAGAAWMSIALEAHKKKWMAHGMQGFDYEAARKKFSIPEHYTVEAMVAVGKAGDKESLPADLKEKEEISLRKPLEELIGRGKFTFR